MNSLSGGPGEPPVLRSRASCRTITPEQLPIALGGYAVGQDAERIESPLEVNCLCLDDGNSKVVIVSLDLLYVTQDLRKAVQERTGISGAELFMAASHTHYAPAIDSTKPQLGIPNEQYRDRIASIVADAIQDAVQGPKEETNVFIGHADMSIGVNRRRKRIARFTHHGIEINRVAMGPNPEGPTDPVSTVVAFRSRDRTVAYLWAHACHPTGLADGACVTAHWPGVVRQEVRRRDRTPVDGSDDVAVLFLQGFSGDVRPPSGRAKSGPLRSLVKRVRLGPVFENLDDTEYSDWALRSAQQVGAITEHLREMPDYAGVQTVRVEVPATRFALGAERLPPVSFHRVSFGSVAIVGASAELVSGYADMIRSLAPHEHVIPVGCIDHVIGYWPLQSMFREGGYEVAQHCPSFGITACAPDIEARVLEHFRLLWNDKPGADRQTPTSRGEQEQS